MNSITLNQFDEEIDDDNEFNPVYEDVMDFSKDLADTYVQEHEMLEEGLDAKHVATLACARLQWVLVQHRLRISGIFTEAEILQLLDCNMERLFIPGCFSSLPSDLCDHHGIELESYASSPLKGLIKKLLSLDDMQYFALADALEQTWHRGSADEQTPKEFLETLGIELT